MDEKEIALKVAEATLQNKQLTFLTDCIKIGFPSLVAIISAYFSFKMNDKNIEVNKEIAALKTESGEKITSLKLSHEHGIEDRQRKFKLIEDLSDCVSETYDVFQAYGKTLRGKAYSLSKGEPTTLYYENLIRTDYLATADIKNKKFVKMNTIALLLGDDDLIEMVSTFDIKHTSILAECPPDNSKSLEELDRFGNEMKECFEALSTHLSELYWQEDSTN